MPARLALALVGLIAVAACKPASSKAPIRPLMWSITKDGKTTYALGTMHTGIDPRRLPAPVWDMVDHARVVAFEADVSGVAEMPMRRTDGRTLRDELGPVYWKKLEAVLGANEAAQFETFTPLVPTVVVTTRSLPNTPAIDSAIEQRARDAKKPIVYLEKLSVQFEALAKWLDARALEDSLDDMETVDRTGRDMLAAYAAGDETQVFAITHRERVQWILRGRSLVEYEQQLTDLLYRRNASWLPAIEKLHADGGGLIAVGAAHLIGPHSVLDLLAQHGYSVTRISP